MNNSCCSQIDCLYVSIPSVKERFNLISSFYGVYSTEINRLNFQVNCLPNLITLFNIWSI
jgi:hypothetical protein